MDYKKPQSTLVQGGAGIYPLTTADQVILADGSRLEKDGRISADSAANSAKLGGKAPEYYLQPRNLLDNSDFRNPVNQRGQTDYTNNGYTIDRWELYSGAVGVSSLGYITTSGQMYQKIAIPTDKVYTFAIENDAGIALVTGIPANGIHSATLGNALIKLATIDGYAEVVIEPSEGHNLAGAYWAALYEGSYTAETLPPYVPKGYAAELAECDLHYRPLGDNVMSVIAMTSSDGGVVLLKSIRPMRDGSVPTIINNGTLYARVNGVDYTLTDVRILKSDKSGVEILANASGAPSKQDAMIHGSALLALSRDL